jgi:heme/copper-type cytochrome/quinol oxidase subunit 2
MSFPRRVALNALLLCSLGFAARVWAGDPAMIEVTIKGHRFVPAELHVPSGGPAVLRIINADDTIEEFDSAALQVEKLIPAGHSATVRLRPLAPGRFPFSGEYHVATAQGVVISDP